MELICAVGLPFLWQLKGATLHAAFLAVYLFILSLLTVTDLEQRRIPNVVMYPALGLALIGAFVCPPGDWRSALLGGAAAFAFFWLLYGLGVGFAALLRRWPSPSLPHPPFPSADSGRGAGGRRGEGVRALGAGDVKLATFVGLVSGWPGVVVALGLGMVMAAACAGALILVRWRRGQYRPGQTMPYGPFLAAGAAVVLLFWS